MINWTKYTLQILLFTSLFLVACESEGIIEEEEIDPFLTNLGSVELRDVGNTNNLGDLLVRLKFNDMAGTSALRVYLIETSELSRYVVEDFSSLGADFYTEKSELTTEMTFTLNENQKLVGSSALEVDKTYTARLLMNIEGTWRMVNQIPSRTITDDHPLSGDYRGSWNDNLYTSYQVSANLNFSNGALSGPFFYTNSFTSCCGGNNDGFVSFTFDEDASLSFVYNQDLLNFMSGCPGLYSGDGQVIDYLFLDIDFTGNDCEGEHVGGVLLMEKLPE